MDGKKFREEVSKLAPSVNVLTGKEEKKLVLNPEKKDIQKLIYRYTRVLSRV
jgi:hypothetical protein